MKGILLVYLILALYSESIRRWPLVLWCRFWRIVALRGFLHLPWRVAIDRARREIP